MRERHVYKTDEIPHKWAHRTLHDVCNPQGNLFFEGDTIYSYRRGWPLAKIYIKGKAAHQGGGRYRDGQVLVLCNSNKYGNTTAKHQSAVNRAVSHLSMVSVPNPDLSGYGKDAHKQNLAYLEKEAARMLDEAKRVLSVHAVEWRGQIADKAESDWKAYAAFFVIRRKFPLNQQAGWEAAIIRARAIENPDPVRDAAKFRAKAKRTAARDAKYAAIIEKVKAENADKIIQWRAGESVRFKSAYWDLPRSMRYAANSLDTGVPCMCRVKGDVIETSHGASIPVAHAARLWRVIQAARAGLPYTHNGHSEHAGDFVVDSIDVDGTLRAGCHVIEYPELEALARTLGLS